jgi:hypothetical protein
VAEALIYAVGRGRVLRSACDPHIVRMPRTIGSRRSCRGGASARSEARDRNLGGAVADSR